MYLIIALLGLLFMIAAFIVCVGLIKREWRTPEEQIADAGSPRYAELCADCVVMAEVVVLDSWDKYVCAVRELQDLYIAAAGVPAELIDSLPLHVTATEAAMHEEIVRRKLFGESNPLVRLGPGGSFTRDFPLN